MRVLFDVLLDHMDDESPIVFLFRDAVVARLRHLRECRVRAMKRIDKYLLADKGYFWWRADNFRLVCEIEVALLNKIIKEMEK